MVPRERPLRHHVISASTDPIDGDAEIADVASETYNMGHEPVTSRWTIECLVGLVDHVGQDDLLNEFELTVNEDLQQVGFYQLLGCQVHAADNGTPNTPAQAPALSRAGERDKSNIATFEHHWR